MIKILKFLFKLIIEIPFFCCFSPNKYDISKLEEKINKNWLKYPIIACMVQKGRLHHILIKNFFKKVQML